jgi:hypothetical protein
MQAYVLIHTEAGRESEVAGTMRDLPGIQGAEVVTGPYDVIAVAAAPHHAQLIHVIIDRVRSTPGVVRIVMCPASSHQDIWEFGSEPAFAVR